MTTQIETSGRKGKKWLTWGYKFQWRRSLGTQHQKTDWNCFTWIFKSLFPLWFQWQIILVSFVFCTDMCKNKGSVIANLFWPTYRMRCVAFWLDFGWSKFGPYVAHIWHSKSNPQGSHSLTKTHFDMPKPFHKIPTKNIWLFLPFNTCMLWQFKGMLVQPFLNQNLSSINPTQKCWLSGITLGGIFF